MQSQFPCSEDAPPAPRPLDGRFHGPWWPRGHGGSALALALALALAGCGGADPKPAAPPAAPPTAAPAAPLALAPASVGIVDPPAQAALASGKAKIETPPALSLPVITVETNAGHTYLWAKKPGPPLDRSALDSELERLSCAVKGPRTGVAVAVPPPENAVLVRLVGPNAPPDTLEVECARATRLPLSGGDAENDSSVGRLQTIRLTGAQKADHKPARAAFFLALAAWLEERARIDWSRTDPTLVFAANRARLLGEARLAPPAGPNRPSPRTELGELMSLYTGLTSAEEALQTDRGLLLRADDAKARTVPLSGVKAIPLAAHPWEKMIAERKLTPKVEPLAAVAPADALYLHFGDLRMFVTLLRDVDAFLAPAARALEMSPGEWGLAERYERELAVERTGLAEKLGHIAANGVAVVVGDPLAREGTDMALLFDIGNEMLLQTALAGFAASAKARRPDLAESTVTLAGRPVMVLSTPDGEVRRHQVKVGTVLVVANSPAAVTRILETVDGKRPSLAKSGDFRYFRGLYPAAGDAGFAFVSDAFVGRVTGPAFKVAASRRMQARADLAAVASASLLYGWLEGKPAPDAKTLLKEGYILPVELKHDDGRAIAFDTAAGPSSPWGSLARLTSLSEVGVDRITPAERDAYDRFREGYQTYWRTYIDPVGVELRRRPDGHGWKMDGRLLPLIEGTEYNELFRMTGNGAMRVEDMGEGVSWRIAVGPDSPIRRDLESTGRGMPGLGQLTLSWLGEWVGFGVLDRNTLWDIAVHQNEVRSLERSRSVREMEALAQLPLYGEVNLRDRLAFAAFLTGIRAFAHQTTGGIVDWGEGAPYRDVPVTVIRERAERGRGRGLASGLELHYAIAGDVCILTLRRDVLEARIDTALAAADAAGADDAGVARTQVTLQYAPRTPDGGLNRATAAVAEKQMERAQKAALRASEVLLRAFGSLPPEARTARARAFLGYLPVSPLGGTFALDSAGRVSHAQWGTELEPVVPAQTDQTAPLTGFLRSLARLSLNLGFEGEGTHRGLHVGAEWTARP